MTLATETEINVQQAVPFFAVADIQQSVRFYVDGLGFEITTNGSTMAGCNGAGCVTGALPSCCKNFNKQGHDSWLPEGKKGEGVSIYFICKDALAVYGEVISRGIQASKPMVANGMWVTTLSDPDGYKLNFESPTDETEGTELS